MNITIVKKKHISILYINLKSYHSNNKIYYYNNNFTEVNSTLCNEKGLYLIMYKILFTFPLSATIFYLKRGK